MTKYITPNEVEWRSGNGDPLGRLFQYQGELYRAIWKEETPYVLRLFSSGLVAMLVEKRLLVPTEITSMLMPGYGLILSHKTLPFVTRSFYWPRTVLLDAARLVIRLNLELLPFGVGTIDCHSFNVVLGPDSRPFWVDFGSLVPVSKLSTTPAAIHTQFCEYFINPLVIYANNVDASFACRQLLQRECISSKDLTALTGITIDCPVDTREKWLRFMMRWLDELSLPQKDSQWGEYYKNEGTYKLLSPESRHAPDSRAGVIQAIIRKHQPQKVIDIGCNAGIFSCLAAYEGAVVHSLDYDENAIELFYQTLLNEKRSLPITLSVRDVTNWHPQHLFPIIGDMAFALAITHHLSLGQNLTFGRIAWLLAQYTTGTLITEFMPRGLGVDSIAPNPLPSFYTLENLMNAFKPYFESVRQIEFINTVGHRIIVCCEGRNLRSNVEL